MQQVTIRKYESMTNNKIKLQSKKNIKGILVSMACAIIGIGVGISVGFAI
jgi:hypothetical protein